MKNIIFHIDVNSAFLSWEAVYRLYHKGGNLDLREVPSAVGGDVSLRHGIILAKSIPAKDCGIKTGETILEAKRKCPNLVLVPPNYSLYEQCSAAFMDILREFSDVVEQYSIDESFVDMTTACHLFGTPEEAAEQMKNRIRDELGFTVNVGISSNKLLAKMAGEFEKPDKVHTLFPDEIREKMWPLPVRELFLVGRASEEKLKQMGINTIGDLARSDPGVLKAHLKKHGEALWNYANGRDSSPVESEAQDNKCYGNSVTLAYDVTDREEAKRVLLSLSESVGRRLRMDGVWIEMVSVTIRFFDLTRSSHQCVLEHATNITDEIYRAAGRLFDELWDGTPIRLLGVQTGKVTKNGDNRQLSLFDDMDYERQERLDRAMDSIRERFGTGAVQRASFLKAPGI